MAPRVVPSGKPPLNASARRKQTSKVKYEIDFEALTSELPWFELAMTVRVTALMDNGESEQEAYDAALLRMTSLDTKTEKGYASAWMEFEQDFCSPLGYESLPATESTALKYISWHARRGKVHEKSLANYISAINRAHKDCLFLPPFETDSQGKFINEDIRLTLLGLAKAQGVRTRDAVASERLYLPAKIPLQFLQEVSLVVPILGQTSSQQMIGDARDDLALAFSYAEFGRSASQAGFRTGDIVFESDGSLLFAMRKAKNLTKNKHNLAFRWPVGCIALLLDAVKLWTTLRYRIGGLPEQFWRLPWEKRPLVGSDFNAMLGRSLARRGMSPPPGFVYTIHSTRAGSLSEGAALGVPLSRLKHMGGYSPTSTVPEDKYIDPSCPPSPAGRHFFGWLLPTALPLSA